VFELVRAGDFRILISSITYDELEGAPVEVQEVLSTLPGDAIEEVRIDEEVHRLAGAYLEAGAVGRSALYDALHVAAASVARADLILSWNFEHIVNFQRIRKFNAVNLLEGYHELDIRSPLETANGDQGEDI